MKKSHLPEILACAVVLLVATYFIRAWKIKKDRSTCIINIRNVQQAMRGHIGITNAQLPAEQMWNEIFDPVDGYLRVPKCPSGGTYTFHKPDPIVISTGFLYCTCSHAKSLGHEPDDYSDW